MNHRNEETRKDNAPAEMSSRRFIDYNQLLIGVATYRRDQSSSGGKFVDQLFWNFQRRRSQNDPIERSLLGPAAIAVPLSYVNISISQTLEGLVSRAREFGNHFYG